MEEGAKIPKTLMDAEAQEHMRQMNEKAEKLSRVALEIEAILVREGMTWGEWGEVVELFSSRIGQFVSNIKITFLKKS